MTLKTIILIFLLTTQTSYAEIYHCGKLKWAKWCLGSGCSSIISPKQGDSSWFFKLKNIRAFKNILDPLKTKIEPEIIKSKEFAMFLHDFIQAVSTRDIFGDKFIEPFLKSMLRSEKQISETAAIFKTATNLGIRPTDIAEYFNVKDKSVLNGRDFLAHLIDEIGLRLPPNKAGYQMFVDLTNHLNINFDRGELLGVWVASKLGKHHRIRLEEVIFSKEGIPELHKSERRSDGFSYEENFYGIREMHLVEFKNRLNSIKFGEEEALQIKDYLYMLGKIPTGHEGQVIKIQYFFSSYQQAKANIEVFRSLDKKKYIEIYYVSDKGKLVQLKR